MTFDDAVARLLNHANLPCEGDPSESLLYLLRDAHKGGTMPDLSAAIADVLDCLEAVNLNWNGRPPSTTPDTDKEMRLDRWVVYSASIVVHGVWERYHEWREGRKFAPGVIENIGKLAWALSAAWEQVLAGDIDSLREDLRHEAWANDNDLSWVLEAKPSDSE
jgi:hypothetical protein